MAKIERKYLAHYINTAASGEEAKYTRLGKDLEEFAPEMAAEVETKKNILGETNVLISGYQKTASVEPYYAEAGSELFDRLQAIVDNNLVLEDLKTDVVEIKLWETETEGAYIDVSYYTMTIHKEIDSQEVDHVIDYRHIVEVGFSLAKGSVNGYLSIREETDQLLPVENEWDAVCDEKTLVINEGMNSVFSDIYTYLQQCKCAFTKNAERKQSDASKHSRCANTICCPKCKSSRYFVLDRPYQRPFIRGKSLVLAIMMCILYLCHKTSSRGYVYTCLDCGNKWMIK